LAYDPKVLLKIVLYGYSKGMVSSRKLEEACRRHVVFMALSADTRPHFTTIAGFVAELEREIVELFRDVLLYCDELGLIGKEHFAVDGCKLPSNASKQWSGTHAELRHKQQKMAAAARAIVRRHRERDAREQRGAVAEQEEKKLATYRAKITKIKRFLARAKQHMGPSGKERKSNITDADSAKMSTAHGVIQGYNGVAVVDDRHQIVVHAEAQGEGQENHLLQPMVVATRETLSAIGCAPAVVAKARFTADSGYHSRATLQFVAQSGVDAYVADPRMRRRDPAFAQAGRYKERHRQERRRRTQHVVPKWFTPADFVYDAQKQTCICPAGERLYRNGVDVVSCGYRGTHFRAPQRACRPCELRRQCLRHPERTVQRQVMFFPGRVPGSRRPSTARPPVIEAMQRKIDTPLGRAMYDETHGHRGAGVREPSEQGHAPVHFAEPAPGRRAMEAVHAGAQHREGRPRQGRMMSGPGARRRPSRPPQSARTDRGRRSTRLPSAVQPFANRHRVFLHSRSATAAHAPGLSSRGRGRLFLHMR
jgi:hypothetical protein